MFQNFPVAKKFVDKRGVYQDFPSKYFSLTVPKNFAGESFTVSLISGIENLRDKRKGGGGASTSSAEDFCLIVPNIS